MGKQPTNPHSFLYFGDELIQSEDLDPVYVTLVTSGLESKALKRTMLAYWCFYSLGTAARVAEHANFYEGLWRAHAEKWPHGFERRHFYNAQAEAAIKGLEAFGPAEKIVDYMTQHDTFTEVDKAVQSFRGFGPWMAWKVGDMAERVLDIPVKFNDTYLGVYKDPKKGAALMWHGDKNAPINRDELAECCDYMEEDFKHQDAPPHYDRVVNIQEVETVLCKYKAYYYGHYHVGKDVKEMREGLHKAYDLGCDLAQFLLACSPSEYITPFTPEPYVFEGDGYHEAVCGNGSKDIN